MKIRNGFVSNSSSSSFIVGIKDGVEAEVDFEGEDNKGKIVRGKISIPGTTASDINSLKSLFKWEFDFDIDEAMKNKKANETGIENFKRCKKALKEGKYIVGCGILIGGQDWEPCTYLNEGDEEEVDPDALLYNNGGIEAFIDTKTMEVIAEEYGNGVV